MSSVHIARTIGFFLEGGRPEMSMNRQDRLLNVGLNIFEQPTLVDLISLNNSIEDATDRVEHDRTHITIDTDLKVILLGILLDRRIEMRMDRAPYYFWLKEALHICA